MENVNNLEEILKFNKAFVENREYEKYNTTKYPDKKIAILSCMDTRLTELLPKALDLKNGDAKIIKNAGGTIIHPFGSAMRSLLICVYEFDIKEIFVVGHYDCGVSSMDTDKIVKKMVEKGIDVQTLDTLSRAGIKVKQWLHGFDCVEESVKESVAKIRNHPLMPSNIAIHGLIMDPLTGRLDVAVNGFNHI